jgi:hypothetical protein
MRQVPLDVEVPPPGYEVHRVDSGTKLLLPLGEAKERRRILLDQQLAEDKERQEELKWEAEERKRDSEAEATAAAKRATTDVDFGLSLLAEPPPPGFYRVLPRLAELLADSSTDGAKLRSADVDVNQRRSKLLQVLAKKGPDRRVAQPAHGQGALAALEAALPHFREPIAYVRRTLALAQATGKPVRVPPMLLLGPPGVGKTHFTHRLAELLKAPHAAIAFDQPIVGGLHGSDSYWGNSSTGLLFNLLCLGESANPVVLLDELDKSVVQFGSGAINPLAQLHGALEPETSRQTLDLSIEVEFDASMVTYLATANTVRGVGAPLLSRMEVLCIEPPTLSESMEVARGIVASVLDRLGLAERVRFDRQALVALAHFSPRLMVRAAQTAAGEVLAENGERVGEEAVLAAARVGSDAPKLH